MKIGDKVRHKENGVIATVKYSFFGYSLHWYVDNTLHKTLGICEEEILKDWELVRDNDGEYKGDGL